MKQIAFFFDRAVRRLGFCAGETSGKGRGNETRTGEGSGQACADKERSEERSAPVERGRAPLSRAHLEHRSHQVRRRVSLDGGPLGISRGPAPARSTAT